MSAALPVQVTIPSLAMNEDELMRTMENSVYPGADRASIKLVLSYCRGVHKDPLKKVVHIVPMDVKVKKPGGGYDYIKRDVIMEGIASYRIDAARTGQHAGTSEPVFGQMQKLEWKEKYRDDENGPELERTVTFEYPEWCKIVVTRIVDGKERQFTALEYWLENYATTGRGSKVPNAMWKKRSRGQLAKCTEAQALRKGFPDTVSAAPTMEEMEGKVIDGDVIDDATGRVKTAIPDLMVDTGSAEGKAAATANPQDTGPSTDHAAGGGGAETSGDDKPLSDGEKAHVKGKLTAASLTELDLKTKFGVDIEGLKSSQFKAVKEWIKNAAKPAQ